MAYDPSHSGTAQRESAPPGVLAVQGQWLAPIGPGLTWPSAVLRLAGLGAALYFVATSPTPPSRVALVALLATLAAAAWLSWVAGVFMSASARRLPVIVASTVVVLGVAGGLLVGFSPSGYAEAFPCAGVFVASVQMPPRWSLPASAAAAAATGLASLLGSAPSGGLARAALILVGVFLAGLNRRQFRLRALEEERSAALAERASIARELHDVLAHSLAGLTIQLEAARALLSDGSDPARALAHVERAHHLGVEGLAEARQAVAALREDRPVLPELLAGLVESRGEGASLAVRGIARDLSPEVALTLYRSAQEAMTNAARHAPGAPLHLELSYGDHETTLVVVDQYPDGQAHRMAPVSASYGGYGLVGMRERAELAGGTLQAGLVGNGWRVEVRVPA